MMSSGHTDLDHQCYDTVACHVKSCSTSQKTVGEVSCMESTGQGNDFELIPMVKMEITHAVIIAELW